jgi:hypothetical protein
MGSPQKHIGVVKPPPGHASSKPSQVTELLAKSHSDEKTPGAGPQTDDCASSTIATAPTRHENIKQTD